MSIEREPYAILRDDGSVELLPESDGMPAKPDGYQGRQIHVTHGPQQGENLGVVYSRDTLTAAQYEAVEAALEGEAKRRGKA
jgi:hypothetical protein